MSRPELAQYTGEGEGKGRRYKHPFRVGDDKKPIYAPSVTTILKLEDKSSLLQWAVNLTVDWAVVNWMQLASRSDADAKKTAQYRWRDVRDERAFVGTGVHDTIESEHKGLWDFPELDDEQALIMVEWRKLNEEWLIEPILSEFTVWSLQYDYAGTADGLWRFTHRETGETFVALVDIKTSRKTWPGHRMQIAALANADVWMEKQEDGTWVEETPLPFDKHILVHLRAPEFNEYGEETTPGIHDLIEVPDTDLWFEEFLGYRAVLAAQEKRKALEKEREKKTYGGF